MKSQARPVREGSLGVREERLRALLVLHYSLTHRLRFHCFLVRFWSHFLLINNFWDYITTPFAFLLPNVFIQIHTLFFLHCCCCFSHGGGGGGGMCLVFLNTTCSVCILILVLIHFEGWPFGIGKPISVLFPGEEYFSHSWHSLVACISFLLFTTVCLLLFSFFSLCLDSHVGENLWVYLLTLLGNIISQQTSWSSGSYNLSTHSSQCPWSLRCRVIL